jgi:hypothetical protein
MVTVAVNMGLLLAVDDSRKSRTLPNLGLG